MPSRKGHEVYLFYSFLYMIKDNLCRYIWLRFCLCCLVCCFCASLQAQQAEDSITGKVHAIPEVRVKGKRVLQRISVAMPIQVMDKKELQGLGIQNMADAVRRFAGASVRDYGGIGGLKTVSVRSLGATHTAVAYDGIAVSNTQAGQIDIGRFSLDDVEVLSLSVGQDNDLLQSARLFSSAGVLSIYGKNPLENTDKPYSFKGQIKSGSFGLANPTATWAQRISSTTTYTLNGNYLRADGNYPFTLVNGKYISKEKRKNSDIESWHGEANLFHTLKDSSQLNIKAYYFNSERGLPGSIILYNDQANERLWDENFFMQTMYKKDLSATWTMQAQAKYNYSWNKYEDTDVKYEGGKQTDINKQQEYYLSGTLQWQPISAFTTSWANDFALNTLKNNQKNSPAPIRHTWLSAFNIRYQWNKFTATGTLVHTLITEKVKQGNQPEDRHRFSPTVSLIYRPWQSQSLFLTLMYKDTFRVPTFNDLYYLRIGNTDLRPEKAHEYNIGITWSGSPLSFTDYVTFTLDGYYNEIDDKIVALPTTYVWKMMNFGKVHITGADVTLRTAFSLNRNVKLLLTGNYTYQKAIDVTSSDSKNYKDQVPYTPLHNGNISILAENPWVNIGYTLTGVSNRYSLPQNLPENRIDGYTEHTVSVSRSFHLGTFSFRLQAELVNLTNEQYDIIKYYPMPGRNFRIMGSIEF